MNKYCVECKHSSACTEKYSLINFKPTCFAWGDKKEEAKAKKESNDRK